MSSRVNSRPPRVPWARAMRPLPTRMTPPSLREPGGQQPVLPGRQGREADEETVEPLELHEQEKGDHQEQAETHRKMEDVGGPGRGLRIDERTDVAAETREQGDHIRRLEFHPETGEYRLCLSEQCIIEHELLQFDQHVAVPAELIQIHRFGGALADDEGERHEHDQGDERAGQQGGRPRRGPAAKAKIRRPEHAGEQKGEHQELPEGPENPAEDEPAEHEQGEEKPRLKRFGPAAGRCRGGRQGFRGLDDRCGHGNGWAAGG